MDEVVRLDIDAYEDIIGLWEAAGLPFKPQGRDSRDSMEREMSLPQVAFFGMRNQFELVAVGIANYDGRRGWINRVAVGLFDRNRVVFPSAAAG